MLCFISIIIIQICRTKGISHNRKDSEHGIEETNCEQSCNGRTLKNVDLAVDSSRDGLRLWQTMTNVSPPW